MQGGTRVEIPGFHRPTTVHRGRPSSLDGSSEDNNLDNRSYLLPHPTEPLQDQPSTTRMYPECPDYGPSDENLMASAERSSSTCVSVHRPGSLDGPVEPHIRGTSSSSRLTGNQEELNWPPRQRPAPLLQHWKWEILSVLTSIGLLAGILVTLGRYNHGKQPEWPYNININSLISVLTAVIIAQLGFILAESRYNSLVPNLTASHHAFNFEFTSCACSYQPAQVVLVQRPASVARPRALRHGIERNPWFFLFRGPICSAASSVSIPLCPLYDNELLIPVWVVASLWRPHSFSSCQQRSDPLHSRVSSHMPANGRCTTSAPRYPQRST